MPLAIAQFRTNPAAATLQKRGLHAEGAGNFETAMNYFNVGIEHLCSIRGGLDNPHNLMQIIGLERDFAFSSIRLGIAEQSKSRIAAGRRMLEASTEYGETTIPALAEAGYTDAARQRINAEIGASKGLVARAITVQFVMEDEEAMGSRLKLAAEATDAYSDAAALLAEGDNRYYGASNAANAARHFRMMDGAGVPAWLTLAVANVQEAFRSDRRNALPALKTTVDRAIASRTPESALASVLARP